MSFLHRPSAWHIFWITVSILSSILVFYTGWVPNRDGTIFSITSGFSDYLRALDQTGRYASCWQEGQPCFYTTRLPFVPYFHYLISIILGHNLLTHIVAKNLLAYGLTAVVLQRALLERGIPQGWCYLIYGILYLNPFSIRILPTIGGEEGYYAHILFALLIFLSRPSLSTIRLHAIGIALVTLVLIKSTLAPLSVIISLLVAGRMRFVRPALIPVAYVALALFSWSFWSYTTTGHWTHVANISSYDGVNFYKANNPYVLTLYPWFHLDALDFAGLTDPPDGINHDEWMIGTYFKDQAANYLIQDPINALWLLAFKAYTVFLSPVPPAAVYIDSPLSLEELLSQARTPAPWSLKHILISVSIVGAKLLLGISIFAATRAILSGKAKHNAVTYLIFVGLLVTPFIIGFAYTNHLAVLYGLAWLYLAMEMVERAPISSLFAADYPAGGQSGTVNLAAWCCRFGGWRV